MVSKHQGEPGSYAILSTISIFLRVTVQEENWPIAADNPAKCIKYMVYPSVGDERPFVPTVANLKFFARQDFLQKTLEASSSNSELRKLLVALCLLDAQDFGLRLKASMFFTRTVVEKAIADELLHCKRENVVNCMELVKSIMDICDDKQRDRVEICLHAERGIFEIVRVKINHYAKAPGKKSALDRAIRLLKLLICYIAPSNECVKNWFDNNLKAWQGILDWIQNVGLDDDDEDTQSDIGEEFSDWNFKTAHKIMVKRRTLFEPFH
jgi:hypothetical protein